jgi:heme-degrading monooxygenase HmoA
MSKPEVTMFIAMNRFKIKPGCEQDFIEIWKGRDSYLETVPGFKEFHLLQGQSNDEFTLFSSHAVWESKEAFEAWTKSEAFRKAHANAGSRKDIYAGPPQLECFESVL